MKYFRNTELAKIYNVSEKSVRNWIQAARDGKLELQLYESNGKSWIANTTQNTTLIQEQVQKGKKYKNSRALKVVSPRKEFYIDYDQQQIVDIIANLTIHHEIPTQYSYVNGGAQYWDKYAIRLNEEDAPNILNQTTRLLDSSASSIDEFIGSNQHVNVVDLGAGNGLPIRTTLERLHQEGRLNKYVAIDSSKEMLEILEQNIHEWFKGAVAFEGHVLDFSYQRFDHLLSDSWIDDNSHTINLVFLLGGTLNNFRSPEQTLQTINQSLGPKDLLIYTTYLDTPHNRRYFDFSATQPNQKVRTELIINKLGIDDALYETVQGFDETRRARYSNFVPKVDLSIDFKVSGHSKQVELKKGHPVLLWRHWHKNIMEALALFESCRFDLLQATKSKDQQYALVISKIRVDE